MKTKMVDAPEILEAAGECIGDRAAERDTESERSMARTVAVFNALKGTALTERDGWEFMVCLKMARAQSGKIRLDDFIDGAAYQALAGEAAQSET